MVTVITNLDKRKTNFLLKLNYTLLIFLIYFVTNNLAFSKERGQILAHAAGCFGCHTANKDIPYSGGYKINTKYGTFISPNITFDEKNGIGKWNLEEFTRALKHGISPKGVPYYPVFPYNWYKELKNNDINDIYNYLRSIPIQSIKQSNHKLKFPYNFRALLWIRSKIEYIFFSNNQFNTNNEIEKQGSYIVKSIVHCGACHSPRTFLSIVKNKNDLSGRPKSHKKINDEAPNISNNKTKGIGSWDENDIVFFLQTGFKPDGDYVEGHMTGIIEDGTSYLSENELKAVSKYLLSQHNK